MSHSTPSYEERIRNKQFPASTDATKELFWYIQGPLETNPFALEGISEPSEFAGFAKMGNVPLL